jgi:hypothetical protein
VVQAHSRLSKMAAPHTPIIRPFGHTYSFHEWHTTITHVVPFTPPTNFRRFPALGCRRDRFWHTPRNTTTRSHTSH